MNISLGLYLIILITGCSIRPKEKILAPDLFAKIYVEAILQSTNSSDSLQTFQMVLDKYNITREQFEESNAYFEKNPELWLEIFNKVVEELEARVKETETKQKGIENVDISH